MKRILTSAVLCAMVWQAGAGETTVVSGKVYDLGKLSFSRDAAQIPELRRDDLRMCWIAAGSNLLQHWQDSYLSLHDAGREVPNGIVGPLDIKPYGTGYLAIYREFLKHWTDGGGMNLNALTWWLQGTLAYTPSPQQVAQGGLSVQKTPGGGGYFTNIFGKGTDWKPGSAGACGCVVDYGTAPDADLQYAPRTLEDVQRILDEMLQVEGQAGLLALLDFDNAPRGIPRTGAHAICCWGYEKGPDGKLCALYLTDSDDRMLAAFRVNAREYGGAVVMSSNDPSSNYSSFVPGYRVFRALSYIKTPDSAARKAAPASRVPQDGVVSANTQLSAPLECDSLEVVAAPELGQTIFTATASVAVAGGCRIGGGALASMQTDGQGAFSFGSLQNEGQCRLAHAESLTVGDGELVNLGYLDLENVGTVSLNACECGGCLSLEGNTALELDGLRISPVRADIPAALGLAQIAPQGISRIHGAAQLRNVQIIAKKPLLLSGVTLSGVVSIQAASGVQMEDTTLTLGVPQNIRPNALGEIGLSCEKAIIGEASGTLNIRLTAEDASRLASSGVRVIKLRFAPEMHATLVSDQLQPVGDGESFILEAPAQLKNPLKAMNSLTPFLALCCLGVVFVVLYCTPRLRKRREEEWKRRTQAAMERECNLLAECEPQIRQRLAAGELRYLVEWWEDDAPWLEENHHLLFIYTDQTAHEFALFQEVEAKCVSLLAEFGIEWTPGFKSTFDSNILYPPALRGQKFYTPDGKHRADLEL